MDAKQQFSVYVNAYKQAGDAVKPAPSAPAGKKDLTEKALAVLRKRGNRLYTLNKGGKIVGETPDKEAKCAKCGNAVSKCACGKKC